jgi:hypothetical protein
MQKQIGTEQSRWENTIIRDLDYIRANKRYRWNAKLRTPLVVYSILFVLIACLFLATATGFHFTTGLKAFNYFVVPLLSLSTFGVCILNYLQSLKFITLNTGLDKQGNHDLLVSFLNRKQLLVYYHPKTNDVIQIISKPINVSNERREVLVFVIDENVLLINSHFTESGWRLTAASRHDKQMGHELMDWVMQYRNQNGKGIRY